MTMLTPNFAQNSLSEENQPNLVPDAITELLRAHAKTLIAAALETEGAAVIAELKTNGTDVARNGYLPERKIKCAVGDVEVKVPRIRSKDGELVNFTSTLVPKYLRHSNSVSAWAAYAYLKGVSDLFPCGTVLRAQQQYPKPQCYLVNPKIHWKEAWLLAQWRIANGQA